MHNRNDLKSTVLSEKVRLKSYRLYYSIRMMFCKSTNITIDNRSVVARDRRLGEKLITKGMRGFWSVKKYYSIP